MLVVYAAADRYTADRARARTGSIRRAQLYATLLSESASRTPLQAELRHLLGLSSLAPGSVLAVFDGSGRQLAGVGAPGPLAGKARVASALASDSATFEARGKDGVNRVWGLEAVRGRPLQVGFGVPGAATYGDARTALERDIALAVGAVLLALAAAFLLAGRLTAPIRQLARRVGGESRGANEIGTIERGLDELGEAIEESRVELARRADRLAALNSIDRAILDAGTTEEIASAAVGKLRELVGAARASVMMFDLERETATSVAVDAVVGPPHLRSSGTYALERELLGIDELAAGRSFVRDLDSVSPRTEIEGILTRAGIRALASVPLLAEGELLGALTLSFVEAAPVPDDTLAFAREVADQLAVALRQARLRAELEAVVEGAFDGIAVLDSERRIVSANQTAATLLGVPREELIGRRAEDVAVVDPREERWVRFLREGSVEGVFTAEVGGAQRWIEASGRAEFLPGRHLFAFRDITERRALEEQLRQAQKMEAVGQLAGGIAHDFNNLLTAIAGYSRIARRRIGLGPGGTELTELERAAERAVQLTRQLLAFSRRQLLEPVPVDLNEVTSALMPMLTRLIGEDIEIATLAGDDLPAVLVDRGQIEQVIVNLAINARDAMPGGGTITIGTQPVILDGRYAAEHAGVEPGLYVCLSVTDTGVGIDRETQEHIFEPFFTTKEVGLGTGLGLATVHGIVTQSNGHAVVYSELGLGSTFKIYLPAAGADAALPAGPEPWPDELHGSGTILVCEDDDLVRTFIEALLVEHGYRVLPASGPAEALRLMAAHDGEIDVLVTDIVMPLVSGPELAAQVQAARPDVRLVFLSGYTAEAVRDRGDLPPGCAFLEKPFDDISFLRTVGKLASGTGPPALTEDEA